MTPSIRTLCVLCLPALLNACTMVNYIQAKVPPWSHGVPGPAAPPAIDERAKRFAVPDGQSLLYLVKPGPRDLGSRVDVFVDGVDVGTLSMDQYMITPVAPGRHRLKTTAQQFVERRTLLETKVQWVGVRVSETEFIAESGAIHVFEQVYNPGEGSNYEQFTLRQVPLSAGKDMVRAMRLTRFNAYWFDEIMPGQNWGASEEPCVDGQTHLKNPRDVVCMYR